MPGPTELALWVLTPGASVIVSGPEATGVLAMPEFVRYTVTVNVCAVPELLITFQLTELACRGSPNEPLERVTVRGWASESSLALISCNPKSGSASSERTSAGGSLP